MTGQPEQQLLREPLCSQFCRVLATGRPGVSRSGHCPAGPRLDSSPLTNSGAAAHSYGWPLQGLNWYRSELKQDGDGDVAIEFYEESLPAVPAAETPAHAPADAPHTPLKACSNDVCLLLAIMQCPLLAMQGQRLTPLRCPQVPSADLKAACMGDVFVDRGEVLVVPTR